MYSDSYYTKENISRRILKRSAEFWGYDETSLDQFDPLVKLLIEGCAVEFEKIGQEIKGTELRLMRRLAAILCPQIQRGPKPAIAIAQARSIEAKAWVDKENQLVCRRSNVRKGEASEVFFSPVGRHSIVNAAIVYYATPVGLYAMERGSRNLLSSSLIQKGGDQNVWVGIDMDQSIDSFEGFRFYIDWPTDISQGLYREFLPFTSWESGRKKLNYEVGLKTETTSEEMTLLGIKNHFVNITSQESWEKGEMALLSYPPEFEEIYDRSLQTLKKPLVWLKIKWPAAFPIAGFENIKIALNAFPVSNRQLHKLTYRLQSGINGIALPSNEAFLGVNTIVNQKNQFYTASDKDVGFNDGIANNTYTLREQGIGRFDQRNAKEFLYQLMELLRDEVTAFNALGEDFLASILTEIAQNMARIEQKLGVKRANETYSQPYLVVKGNKDPDNLYISYWTTSAELANGLSVGSRLQSYSASALNNAEIMLLTSSFSGKPAPEETQYVRELRKNIITCDRLITAEDIRAYCAAELGDKVRKVNMRPHFIKGNLPGQGFVRCIQIQLTPAGNISNHVEWIQNCDLLKSKVEKLSTGMYPIDIITA
ncbi:type VI secretion system baseplate subunit TssF [Dyadobacter sp. 3J3]|uniref:type VI secretion system baseplate subunit TssF n=1 Tax=Dyadobacter sp. 3J3 TaxID=2606600 RepID=UPI00135A9CB1|nr:type VI secretion system baseplate subunit TssF [Dyadobacter sp. 3J3]